MSATVYAHPAALTSPARAQALQQTTGRRTLRRGNVVVLVQVAPTHPQPQGAAA